MKGECKNTFLAKFSLAISSFKRTKISFLITPNAPPIRLETCNFTFEKTSKKVKNNLDAKKRKNVASNRYRLC